MKRTYFNLIALGICLLSLASSCKKQGLDALPPATTNGSNTFGCLIDGKPFVGQNHSELFLHVAAAQGYYYQGTLSILGSYYFGRDVSGDIYGVSIDIQTPKHTGTIAVPGATGNVISYSNNSGTFRFSSDSLHSGVITITRFDSVTHIYSGTFQGSLVDKGGKTVQVTNGRFDVKGKY